MPLGQTGLSDSWLMKVRNNVIIMEGLAFRFFKKKLNFVIYLKRKQCYFTNAIRCFQFCFCNNINFPCD